MRAEARRIVHREIQPRQPSGLEKSGEEEEAARMKGSLGRSVGDGVRLLNKPRGRLAPC